MCVCVHTHHALSRRLVCYILHTIALQSSTPSGIKELAHGIINHYLHMDLGAPAISLVPLTVRVFDNDMRIVAVRFLEMCLCTSGTAAAYESVFNNKSIPRHNSIAFSVDNASVNVGRRN